MSVTVGGNDDVLFVFHYASTPYEDPALDFQVSLPASSTTVRDLKKQIIQHLLSEEVLLIADEVVVEIVRLSPPDIQEPLDFRVSSNQTLAEIFALQKWSLASGVYVTYVLKTAMTEENIGRHLNRLPIELIANDFVKHVKSLKLSDLAKETLAKNDRVIELLNQLEQILSEKQSEKSRQQWLSIAQDIVTYRYTFSSDYSEAASVILHELQRIVENIQQQRKKTRNPAPFDFLFTEITLHELIAAQVELDRALHEWATRIVQNPDVGEQSTKWFNRYKMLLYRRKSKLYESVHPETKELKEVQVNALQNALEMEVRERRKLKITPVRLRKQKRVEEISISSKTEEILFDILDRVLKTLHQTLFSENQERARRECATGGSEIGESVEQRPLDTDCIQRFWKKVLSHYRHHPEELSRKIEHEVFVQISSTIKDPETQLQLIAAWVDEIIPFLSTSGAVEDLYAKFANLVRKKIFLSSELISGVSESTLEDIRTEERMIREEGLGSYSEEILELNRVTESLIRRRKELERALNAYFKNPTPKTYEKLLSVFSLLQQYILSVPLLEEREPFTEPSVSIQIAKTHLSDEEINDVLLLSTQPNTTIANVVVDLIKKGVPVSSANTFAQSLLAKKSVPVLEQLLLQFTLVPGLVEPSTTGDSPHAFALPSIGLEAVIDNELSLIDSYKTVIQTLVSEQPQQPATITIVETTSTTPTSFQSPPLPNIPSSSEEQLAQVRAQLREKYQRYQKEQQEKETQGPLAQIYQDVSTSEKSDPIKEPKLFLSLVTPPTPPSPAPSSTTGDIVYSVTAAGASTQPKRIRIMR